MTTQRRVWSCWDVPESARPAMCVFLPFARLTFGIVLPVFLLFAFGLAVSDGKVVWEMGRHLGPLNYHCLGGVACGLFGLGGLLGATALSMWGWCIGRQGDCARNGKNYALATASGLCFVASMFVDALLKG